LEPPRDPLPHENERILVVDDDELILESLVSIFESEGFHTSYARRGEEALRLLERESFNLILVDMKLPDMTGLELLGRIRDTTPRIRKLVLTGFPDAPSAIEAANQKVDAYLVKPYDPEKLIRLVERNLEEQRQELKYMQERVLDYIRTRVRQLDETR
jgi:DNA-binding NtrC family response regulator